MLTGEFLVLENPKTELISKSDFPRVLTVFCQHHQQNQIFTKVVLRSWDAHRWIPRAREPRKQLLLESKNFGPTPENLRAVSKYDSLHFNKMFLLLRAAHPNRLRVADTKFCFRVKVFSGVLGYGESPCLGPRTIRRSFKKNYSGGCSEIVYHSWNKNLQIIFRVQALVRSSWNFASRLPRPR